MIYQPKIHSDGEKIGGFITRGLKWWEIWVGWGKFEDSTEKFTSTPLKIVRGNFMECHKKWLNISSNENDKNSLCDVFYAVLSWFQIQLENSKFPLQNAINLWKKKKTALLPSLYLNCPQRHSSLKPIQCRYYSTPHFSYKWLLA